MSKHHKNAAREDRFRPAELFFLGRREAAAGAHGEENRSPASRRQLFGNQDETNFNETETAREQACGRFVETGEHGPAHTGAVAGRLGASFMACVALEVDI